MRTATSLFLVVSVIVQVAASVRLDTNSGRRVLLGAKPENEFENFRQGVIATRATVKLPVAYSRSDNMEKALDIVGVPVQRGGDPEDFLKALRADALDETVVSKGKGGLLQTPELTTLKAKSIPAGPLLFMDLPGVPDKWADSTGGGVKDGLLGQGQDEQPDTLTLKGALGIKGINYPAMNVPLPQDPVAQAKSAAKNKKKDKRKRDSLDANTNAEKNESDDVPADLQELPFFPLVALDFNTEEPRG